MRSKRDYAMLAMLFGCGSRRSEPVGLELDDIQMRQGHWAMVDLIGKGGHIRTVPIPNWVKAALDSGPAPPMSRRGESFEGWQKGKGVGQRVIAERRLVRGQNVLPESRPGAHCATRSAENLCKAVSRQRRRVGADSVSAGARICTNDRTLSWVQTKPWTSGERSI